jgi:ribosomal protein S18 acetylase RimI-like enzyme
MIQIRQITELDSSDVHRLIFGYTSHAKYAVERVERASGWTFTLERVPLAQPYVKRYDHVGPAVMDDFQRFAATGFTFGAFEERECVGLAIASPEEWNKTYHVHELHTAPAHFRRGVGCQLIDALVKKGRAAGLRTLLCETQTTNAPAIAFYLRMGFRLEGLDLSRYRNTDYPDGEIMLAMKMPL